VRSALIWEIEASSATRDNDDRRESWPEPKQDCHPMGADFPPADDSNRAPLGGTSEWDAAPAPVLEKGQVVFGKYRRLEKIGEGGMGEVWKVQHIESNRIVALKLIRPEIARRGKVRKQFEREAEILQR
jgi:eukaryotic-like serine/threonine-protein kinase